jgi:hypothetical protein
MPVTYSVLSATAKLGIAAEDTDATHKAPSFTIPFSAGTKYRSVITQLRDRTLRGIDADLQDIQQGPYWSDWTITTQGYPDWAGWLLRAMIGPDDCTPGIVTSLAGSPAAGAASVNLAASVPSGSVLKLGTGDSTEYIVTGTPAGTGPYTIPLTQPSGLRFAHSAGDPVMSQAVHVFRQDRSFTSPPWPSYSLTTDDGVDVLGWPGCILGKITLKVAATGYVTFTSSWSGFPPLAEATFAESESPAQPFAGWAWQVTTAGGASTRGESLTLSLSRPVQITPACDGNQAPYWIGAGGLRADASYRAIFDTPADLNLYRVALQEPAVWTLAQPQLQGGSSVALTMSRSGWTDGAVDLSGQYVTAGFKLSGIASAADNWVSQATLVNYVQSPFGP